MVSGDVLLHYRLAEPIGEGGMGQVWRATDTTLGRDVAIKFLPPAFAEDPERLVRFEREAKVLAALNHPHIAAIYGFHEARGVRFLVMELVPGETIAERIERGRVPVDEVRRIGLAIASALEYAHEHGIVHRDLKPSNVKIDEDGTVKVLDFGLAKAIAGDPSGSGPTSTPTFVPTVTSGNTATGIILGTAAYMSPEQARGRPVDKRADIWAFGVVLYEMLLGRRLFDGETSTDTLAAVITGPIPFDDLPAAMRSLVRRCIDRDLRTRLRDIGEARIALGGVVVEVAEPRRHPWWPYALGGALAGALLAFTVHAAIRHRGGREVIPAIRATIDLADSLLLVTDDRAIALSPDGTRLAFCAIDSATGASSLFLRPLASLEARPLPGTRGCTYPFWAPDGKNLGFFGEGKLKRVDPGDGIVRVLCDAPEGRGGSWSPRGVIAFAPGAYGPIFEVADTGGTPKELIKSVRAGETQRLPHFLPDGRRILFTWTVRAERSLEGVYVFDPDGGEPQRILPSHTEAAYVDPGYLAYVEDGNLMLRRFDTARLELEGEPQPIAAGAYANFTRNFVNFSLATNGTLVYQQLPPANTGTLLWIDREGHETPAPGAGGRLLDAALSPDEKTVSLNTIAPNGQYRTVLVDLDRGVATAFGDPKHSIGGGMWSPDGRAFSYIEEGDNGWSLRVANLATQAAPVVVGPEGYEYEAGPFTLDGRELLYERREGTSKHATVMIAPVDGKSPARTLIARSESCGEPRLSPDGRLLSFRCEMSGRDELMVTTFPDIGAVSRVSTDGVWRSQWGWTSPTELWWIDPSAHGWTAVVTSSTAGPRIAPPKPLFGGKATTDSDVVPCYSRKRDRFLVVREDLRAETGALIYVSDWRAALNGP